MNPLIACESCPTALQSEIYELTIVVSLLFLYYPLVFIVQMSFTLGSSYLSQRGPDYSTANYGAMLSRYLPNVFVTLQLAALSTLVNLIFGFPFAYVLVRAQLHDGAAAAPRRRLAPLQQDPGRYPLLNRNHGRDEVLFLSSGELTAYDPRTGRKYWSYSGEGLSPTPSVPSPAAETST